MEVTLVKSLHRGGPTLERLPWGEHFSKELFEQRIDSYSEQQLSRADLISKKYESSVYNYNRKLRSPNF